MTDRNWAEEIPVGSTWRSKKDNSPRPAVRIVLKHYLQRDGRPGLVYQPVGSVDVQRIHPGFALDQWERLS